MVFKAAVGQHLYYRDGDVLELLIARAMGNCQVGHPNIADGQNIDSDGDNQWNIQMSGRGLNHVFLGVTHLSSRSFVLCLCPDSSGLQSRFSRRPRSSYPPTLISPHQVLHMPGVHSLALRTVGLKIKETNYLVCLSHRINLLANSQQVGAPDGPSKIPR